MENPVLAQKLIYVGEEGPPFLYEESTGNKAKRRHNSRKRPPPSLQPPTSQVIQALKLRSNELAENPTNLSAGDLPGDFPPELAFRAMAAYALLRTLSRELRLSPFTPNAFLRALYLPCPNKIMGSIHVAILRILFPHLQLGYSYKSQGQTFSKRRTLDNLRVPLLAGDNLAFMDGLTWPVFYDDYCHLTADRIYASLHDADRLVDLRYMGSQVPRSDENFDALGDDDDEDDDEDNDPANDDDNENEDDNKIEDTMEMPVAKPPSTATSTRTNHQDAASSSRAKRPRSETKFYGEDDANDSESEPPPESEDEGDDPVAAWAPRGLRRPGRKRRALPKSSKSVLAGSGFSSWVHAPPKEEGTPTAVKPKLLEGNSDHGTVSTASSPPSHSDAFSKVKGRRSRLPMSRKSHSSGPSQPTTSEVSSSLLAPSSWVYGAHAAAMPTTQRPATKTVVIKPLEVDDAVANKLDDFLAGKPMPLVPLENPDTEEDTMDTMPTLQTKGDRSKHWGHFEPLKKMRAGVAYHRLSVEHKLTILEFLTDELLSVEEIATVFTMREMESEESAVRYGAWPSSEELENLDNEDECNVCRGEGELLCCDGCTASYHRECLDMPEEQQLPEGKWLCPECRIIDPARVGPLGRGSNASLDWFRISDLKESLRLGNAAQPNNVVGEMGGALIPAMMNDPYYAAMNAAIGVPEVPINPEDEALLSLFPGTEFMVVHGFLFRRSQQKDIKNPKQKAEVYKVLPKSEVAQVFADKGVKLVDTWPFCQVPLAQRKDNLHFHTPHQYLMSTATFSPNSYTSIYRRAPIPLCMRVPGSLTQITALMAQDFESQCFRNTTIKLSEALIRDFSLDHLIAKSLRAETLLFDAFLPVKGYMGKVEYTLRKACLLEEIWEGGKEMSNGEKWLAAVSSAKSATKLARLLLRFVDQIHSRAFAEGWFHNPLQRGNEGVPDSERHYEEMPPEWTEENERRKRMWEKTSPDMILRLCEKEGCSLDGFVLGIREHVGKPLVVSRSKRKPKKPDAAVADKATAQAAASNGDSKEDEKAPNPSMDSASTEVKGQAVPSPPEAPSQNRQPENHVDNAATGPKEDTPAASLPASVQNDTPMDTAPSSSNEVTSPVSQPKDLSDTNDATGSQMEISPEMSLPTSDRNGTTPGTAMEEQPSTTSAQEAPAVSDVKESSDVPQNSAEQNVGGASSVTGPNDESQQSIEQETGGTRAAEESNRTPQNKTEPGAEGAPDAEALNEAGADEKGDGDAPHATTEPSGDVEQSEAPADAENSTSDPPKDPKRAPKKASKKKKRPRDTSSPDAGVTRRRTRRSAGRFSSTPAEVVALTGGTVVASEVSLPRNWTPVRGTEAEIEQWKLKKVPKIEKMVKGGFQKERVWPICGRKLFATVGNLSAREMRHLARNGGIVKAPHVAYNTNHEVGQVCFAHVWRKKLAHCTNLDELVLLLHIFESFLDKGAIHSCENVVRRGKGQIPKAIKITQRDATTGIPEHYVVNKSKAKGCWISSEHLDVSTLILHKFSRRQFRMDLRKKYLHEKSLEEKARKAAAVTSSNKIPVVPPAVPRVPVSNPGSTGLPQGLPPTVSSSAPRQPDADLHSKMLPILMQHQMDLTTLFRTCMASGIAPIPPEQLKSLQNTTISRLKIVVGYNSKITTDQLIAIMRQSEEAALKSLQGPTAVNRSNVPNMQSRGTPGQSGGLSPKTPVNNRSNPAFGGPASGSKNNNAGRSMDNDDDFDNIFDSPRSSPKTGVFPGGTQGSSQQRVSTQQNFGMPQNPANNRVQNFGNAGMNPNPTAMQATPTNNFNQAPSQMQGFPANMQQAMGYPGGMGFQPGYPPQNAVNNMQQRGQNPFVQQQQQQQQQQQHQQQFVNPYQQQQAAMMGGPMPGYGGMPHPNAFGAMAQANGGNPFSPQGQNQFPNPYGQMPNQAQLQQLFQMQQQQQQQQQRNFYNQQQQQQQRQQQPGQQPPQNFFY